MAGWQSVLAGLSIFGADSCNGVLSNNVVHIGSEEQVRHIKLMQFTPEMVAKHSIAARPAAEKDYSKGVTPFYSSSSAVDVGMNGVEVLDQGSEGTCVTFSSTAAMDTLIGIGSFTSQSCSLALDMGLGDNWWDGAYYPSQIIDPLKKYGIVQKEVCPYAYPDRDASMTVVEYQKHTDMYASDRAKVIQYKYYPIASLSSAKVALKAGKRVLMAFQLNPNYQQAVQGFDVKLEGWQHVGGLWACKQGRSPNYCGSSRAGHEVIITGFDDAQQLLKIRNSWSSSMGDNGDFYMTYSFFNQQAVDMTEIY